MRWLICTGTVLGVLALAVALDPTYILQGLLKNERFFRGRPTSYWRQAIKDGGHEFSSSFGIVLEGKPESAGVPVLMELLEDQDDQVCFTACNALAIVGANAKPAVPALLKMLKHSNLFHRRNAANTLASILSSCEAKEAVPALSEALKEDDAFVNYHCAMALGRIGRQAEEAVPALISLAKSERAKNPYIEGWKATVGDAAAWALKQIQPAGAGKEESP